jgi:hypothetical protein
MVELTPEQRAQRDHDITHAMDVAARTEEAICRLMATRVEAECENAEQRIITAAMLTAMMITKFGEAKLAIGSDGFGLAVDALVRQMQPMMKEKALDVRFGQAS